MVIKKQIEEPDIRELLDNGKLELNDLIQSPGNMLQAESIFVELVKNYGNQKLINNEKKIVNIEQKIEPIGEKMDDKDLELFGNEIDKMMAEKFKEFSKEQKENISGITNSIGGINNKLDGLEKYSEEGCKDGKCTTKRLDSLEEILDNITKQILNTESIDKIEEKVSGLDEKLNKVCTGVDCIKNELDRQNDTVDCGYKECGKSFSLSQNRVGNKAICPHCGTQLKIPSV